MTLSAFATGAVRMSPPTNAPKVTTANFVPSCFVLKIKHHPLYKYSFVKNLVVRRDNDVDRLTRTLDPQFESVRPRTRAYHQLCGDS